MKSTKGPSEERIGQKLKAYAWRLLAKKSWAKKEFGERLIRYLEKRERDLIPEREAMVKEIVRELEEAGLLDDRDFAERFVRHSLSFRKRGRVAIRDELKKRGVGKELIEEVLKDKEELEVAEAKDLIKRYEKRYQEMAKRKGLVGWEREEFIRNRLEGVLLRRGFGFKVIKEVFSLRLS